jgi:PleD family two-component response regulator
MEVLIIKLGNVYARSLESEAERLLRCAKYEHQREYVVKNLRPFIINIHELSIAMQKAQANEVQKTEERLSTIEGLDSITKTIIELGNIISEGRDGRAKTILRELIGYVPEEDGFERLLDLLRGRHWQEAIKENNRLKEKYTEKMKSLSIADLSKVILAVDDRPEILTFVKNALKDHYKVIAVPSPEKALRALEKQKPNLFLLDIDMPEMSGLELAATIRAIPAYAKTPLIFLTGNSDKDTVASAMKLKCNDFIVKPATHETLLTKIVKQFEA